MGMHSFVYSSNHPPIEESSVVHKSKRGVIESVECEKSLCCYEMDDDDIFHKKTDGTILH